MSCRLSPQHLFPAVLVDLLVVYLSLIYPTTNSRHVAFPASSICICGDSSGANIAAAFLQLMLELHRSAANGLPTVNWKGKEVVIPYPGAVVSHSGYMELTRSLPSEMVNLKFDLISSPSLPPVPPSQYIQDTIWPPTPPRHHVYAPTPLLTHPLLSPVTASDWGGCPTKVLLSVGQECLADGNIILAKNMAEHGVNVVLEMYDGMAHDFLLLFGSTPGGQDCLNRWTAFLQASTTPGAKTQPSKIFGSAFVRSKKGTWREVSVSQIQPHRTRKELIAGMEEMILKWGAPWVRSDS
jgi:acetyl esterase/lipase